MAVIEDGRTWGEHARRSEQDGAVNVDLDSRHDEPRTRGYLQINQAHQKLSQLSVYLITTASVLHLQLIATTPAHDACMSRQMLTKNGLAVYSTLMVVVTAEVRSYRFKPSVNMGKIN